MNVRERTDNTKKKRGSQQKRIIKKRPCRLCGDKVKDVDYKDTDFLGKYISERGKIIPSRVSGNCQKHQRMVANRIKRARIAALLPFVKIKQGVQRERNFTSRRG
ncbi:MAG: 30S ribosomal protein S18 [Candidatus Omnitrophica bacterium]|nr:30S ribosomal protein S18 [Candidatus Omnitrophota bacterium]